MDGFYHSIMADRYIKLNYSSCAVKVAEIHMVIALRLFIALSNSQLQSGIDPQWQKLFQIFLIKSNGHNI